MPQYCIEVTNYVLVDLENPPSASEVTEIVAEIQKSGNWTGTGLVHVLDEDGETVLDY